MLSVALITVRESIEIFLLVMILLKASPNNHIKKIILTISVSSLMFFLLLYVAVFQLKTIIPWLHETIENIEHYMQIIIGVFLLGTGLIFHRMISEKKNSHVSKSVLLMETGIVDTSLTITIVSLILLEGLEIIILSFPIPATFVGHLIGICLGFSVGFSIILLFEYVFKKIPLRYLAVVIEIGIALIALQFVSLGISGLL